MLFNTNMSLLVCTASVFATKIHRAHLADETRVYDTTGAPASHRASTRRAHSALHTYVVLLLHHLYRGQLANKKCTLAPHNNLFSALQSKRDVYSQIVGIRIIAGPPQFTAISVAMPRICKCALRVVYHMCIMCERLKCRVEHTPVGLVAVVVVYACDMHAHTLFMRL